VLLGTTALRSVGSGFQTAVSGQYFNEQQSTDGLTSFTSVLNRNDSNGLRIYYGKSRGTTVGSVTTLQNNDSIAQINFAGADGTSLDPIAARIEVHVDGTPGTNDMPGRLTFSTTPDGASTSTERVRINNSGLTTVGFSAATGPALSTTVPAKFYSSSPTYTDSATAASGTVSHGTINSFDNPAIAATNATVTYTNASTLYVDGAPTAGTNVTITNPYSIFVNGGASYFGGNAIISVADNTNAALRITQTGTGNALVVEDSANPDSTPFTINADGRVVVGGTTPYSVNTITGRIQSQSTSVFDGGFTTSLWSADSNPTFIGLAKSRGASVGTQTSVNQNDGLGILQFAGSDGTSFIEAARITASVDGTPGTNDMPGRLVFSTTADGASSTTERMRITSAGNVGIGITAPSVALDVLGTIEAQVALTQDAVAIAGRAGGTSSYVATITPTTLTASRTITLPDANINFATGLPVANGGTGATTLTANNVILGNGTSAVQFVAPGTTGNVLTSNGTTWSSTAPAVTLAGNNAFTGANTFYNATGQTFGTATSTQDGIILSGRAGGSTSLRITLTPATLSASRTLTLPDPGSNETLGYLNIPQNSQSAAYTLVLTDAGKHILHPSADTTARTFTIPANGTVAFPIGTAVTFVNQNGAGVVTIAITTDTMRLAGPGTTGSRTLAANGVATAIKVTATEWIISGVNLT
jgi:hypothetical protein